MASWACLVPSHPIWPLLVLFPIQFASLLMTLVRKGLISEKGYHVAYTISLLMPYIAALRSHILFSYSKVPLLTSFAFMAYRLRRQGFNKYALWGGIVTARIGIILGNV